MTPSAVIVTVAVYITILFLVAWLSGRRADNAGFFTGNRRTPWYMAAFAMISAAMSGITFISVPGSVTADSFSYMQMVLGFTIGQLVVAFILIPVFYRLRVVSLYEYLDNRFGIASHRTGAWFFFLSKMLRTALVVYVVCAVMQLLIFDRYGLPLWANAAGTMLLVWLYTRQGGVKSLIWTDALKTLCLVTSLVLSVVFIAHALGMSAVDTVRAVVASPHSQIFFFDDPASDRYFWKMFFAGIFALIAMTGLDQDMMQKNLSCRSPRDSQKNIILTALCQAVVILLFLVLGVLLYLYAERIGLALPAKSDQIFSQVVVGGGLPALVSIFFVVGLISSTWSSAGSALTALTTSFTVDLLGAAGRPNPQPTSAAQHPAPQPSSDLQPAAVWQQANEQRLTRTRHAVHAAMAMVMVVVILLFDFLGNDSIINLVYKVASYTYGPILGMFAFGLLTRHTVYDRWVPVAAMTAPVLSIALQWAAARYFDYHIGFELLIYNALFTMSGMSLLICRQKKQSIHL